MEQPINQRIKFILDTLKLSAREFSRAVGVADNNTQNYIAPRFAQPKADYLEKVLHHFESINPVWLLTGKGEPFLSDRPETGVTQTGNFNQAGNKNVQKVKGSRNAIIGTNHGTAMQQNGAVPSDKQLVALALAEKEIQHLRAQLAAKDDLIAAKDDSIALLKKLSLLKSIDLSADSKP